MRICAAQIQPVAGDISSNRRRHLALIELAISYNAQMICFPELSLTGYEPKLAKQLAFQEDERLGTFQDVANSGSIAIALGLPLSTNDKPRISMVIFQPHQTQTSYAKQILHADELPYFSHGERQITLVLENHLIAPAICYESLQDSHVECAAKLHADIYMASVAKSSRSVKKAYSHYSKIAQQYGMIVLMANCVGVCDDFASVGQSAIWNADGEMLAQLDREHEGIVLLDTSTTEASQHYL